MTPLESVARDQTRPGTTMSKEVANVRGRGGGLISDMRNLHGSGWDAGDKREGGHRKASGWERKGPIGYGSRHVCAFKEIALKVVETSRFQVWIKVVGVRVLEEEIKIGMVG